MSDILAQQQEMMKRISELRELAKTVYDSIAIVYCIGPKEYSKYINDWLKDNRHMSFIYYTIDEQKFNSLTEYYKLYVLKKNINCNVNSIEKLIYKNENFLYNTFKQHPNILVELLEYIIIINNFELFEEIFTKHKKDIILKKDVYKKLLDMSYSGKHIEISRRYTRIITQYETEDSLYNNDEDDEIIKKEKELETKNYEILLLQKDKEIQTLKIQMDEMRKFYINS